jgi:hypothetical protein
VIRARPALAVGGLLLVCLAASAARADVGDACPGRYEAAAGPLAGGTQAEQPADFGAVPEACPGSDLSLRLEGELAVHSGAPDFSGDIVANGRARARRRLGPRSWVSIAVDLVTYRYFDNGGLVGSGTGFGPATLGYHLVLRVTDRTSLAAYARALLPIDTARQSGIESGLELGAAGLARPSRRWAFDGGVSLAGPLEITAGVARARFVPAALGEAWFSPKSSFAVFAGAGVRVQVAPSAALVAFTPRVGLRGTLRHGLWLAFLAEAPIAGDDPTQGVVSLFVGWTP